MQKYQKNFKEDVFNTRFEHEIKNIALRFLTEIEQAGGSLDDAITSFCVEGVKAMTKLPTEKAINKIKNIIKKFM